MAFPTPKRKIKDSSKPLQKTHIQNVSVVEMTVDQQAPFEKAVDALLADLIRYLDRRIEGEADGQEPKQMAGTSRDCRRSPK